MNCSCISNNSTINFYNIENVQTRYIPTYYHTQIFTPQHQKPPKVRFTPTFQSKILPSDPKKPNKNFISINKANIAPLRPNSAKIITYKNISRQRKQKQFYNSKGNCNYRSQELWFDKGKNDLFDSLKGNRAYSKERKQIDLSSGDVFDAGKITITQIQAINQEQQIVDNKKSQAQVQTENPKDMKKIIHKNSQNKEKIIQQRNHVIFQKQKQQIVHKDQFIQTKKKIIKTSKKDNKSHHIIEGYPRFTIIRNKPF